MLLRRTKLQLIAFVLITLVGVSYVSAKYVGLTAGLFGPSGCTVSAEFPDSGGIFTNAEVTYRGVTVGKVGTLHLIKNGVRVDLDLTDCTSPKIPADTAAAVSDRSVIGEQYVNFLPPNDKGPYLTRGDVIPMSRTTIPVAAQVLLANLDSLVNSVNTTKLATVVSQLGQAFNDQGANLATLLDSSDNLLQAAEQNLPQTIALIQSASKVLGTQLALKAPLDSFAQNLDLLSQQLKSSDSDIRNLLDNGPTDLSIVSSFVQNNRTDLGVTIADLATTGQLLVRHIDGIEEVLELYPALAAGGATVVRSDDVGALGFIVNANDPPDCGDPSKGSQGYGGTTIRSPSDLRPAAPNTDAHCTAPVSSGTNVRGSANVPGGDPISTAGGGTAYPRTTTANTVATPDTVAAGDSLNQAGLLGDDGWLALLTDGLH